MLAGSKGCRRFDQQRNLVLRFVARVMGSVDEKRSNRKGGQGAVAFGQPVAVLQFFDPVGEIIRGDAQLFARPFELGVDIVLRRCVFERPQKFPCAFVFLAGKGEGGVFEQNGKKSGLFIVQAGF